MLWGWDVREASIGNGLLSVEQLATEISVALHGLCQPLTALQCRLEIGMMDATLTGFEAAVRDALVECLRLNGMVLAMQQKVLTPARHQGTEPR